MNPQSPDGVPPNQPEPSAPPAPPVTASPPMAAQQISPSPAPPAQPAQPAQPVAAPPSQPAPLPPTTDPQTIIQNDALAGFPPMAQPKRSNKKRIILAAVAALLIIAATATYVLAFYIPNRPENVWQTSVERTGEAAKKLTAAATDKSKIDSYKKSDIKVKVDAEYADYKYNGELKLIFDTKKYNGELNFTSDGPNSDSEEIKTKFIAEVPDNSQFPNAYLQVTGLKSLVGAGILPAEFGTYDGKWIALESAYLESLGTTRLTEEIKSSDDISSEDIAQLSAAVTEVTAERVFSNDPNKAVFENRGFVKRDTVDGKKTYQYKVGLNKDHAREYCKAMVDRVMSTKAYKNIAKFEDDQLSKEKESARNECQDMKLDGFKDDQTYDVWVDAKYKLIYKVRIPDADQSGTYTDIGQNYTGGDEVSLFVKYHSREGKTDASFSLTFNTANSNTTGKYTYESRAREKTTKATIILEAKPYKGEIDVTVPAGAVSIQEVLKKIGLSPTPATTPTPTSTPAPAPVPDPEPDPTPSTDPQPDQDFDEGGQPIN